MSDIKVVGLGALNTDHMYRVECILDDGEAVVEMAISSPGGSAANTTYGLARLGVSTGFVGVVGDDSEGMSLVRDFHIIGVDTTRIRVRPGVKTGSVLCLSDSLGKRSLYITPGANNLLTIDDLDTTYINQAGILHLSSFADERQFKVLLKLMDKLDTLVKLSFAPGALYAAMGIEALNPILNKTYALFVNQNEIKQLTGKDVVSGTENCIERGCHVVVVTLGKGMPLELGSGQKVAAAVGYIREGGNEYAVESAGQKLTHELDATGAGDAFVTGFLYGLLRGKRLDECGRLGDIAARFSMTKLGARQGLPALGELSRCYGELYNKEL